MNFKLQLDTFFKFVKRPSYNESCGANNKKSIFVFIVLLNCLALIFISITDFLFLFLQKIYFIDGPQIVLSNSNINEDLGLNKFLFFFLIGIIGPFFEELIYRLPLKKKYAAMLLVSIPILVFINFDLSFQSVFTILIILAFLFFTIIYYLNRWKKLSLPIELSFISYYKNALYNEKYLLLFYLFTVIFSLSHIGNYQWSYYNILYGGIIFIVSFITDISFGYLRIKCGFIYAILFHCIYNIAVFFGDQFHFG